jgi:23S rRNA (pseudouridine1915-N3)-methyltransferase
MRLLVAAVGRLRGGPEFDLVADYSERIRGLARRQGIAGFDIKEIDAPHELAGPARRRRESQLLDQAVGAGGRRIILDERGENLTSEEFAGRICAWRDQGAPEAAFLIGGADGHDPPLVASGDLVIAFGRSTFPHMLVRVMLVEQVYRAMTILAGHPYHRA